MLEGHDVMFLLMIRKVLQLHCFPIFLKYCCDSFFMGFQCRSLASGIAAPSLYRLLFIYFEKPTSCCRPCLKYEAFASVYILYMGFRPKLSIILNTLKI